jgi:DNA-binding MarR family transcriptional regulator
VRDALGEFFHHLGLPPIAGRMVAWLALSESGCDSLDAMAEGLEASKASVSNMARLLAERGFVERVPVLDRRDSYRLREDAWENVLRTRLATLASVRGLADEGLWLLGEGEHPARARLESLRELSDVCATFERDLTSLLARLRRSTARSRGPGPRD